MVFVVGLINGVKDWLRAAPWTAAARCRFWEPALLASDAEGALTRCECPHGDGQEEDCDGSRLPRGKRQRAAAVEGAERVFVREMGEASVF